MGKHATPREETGHWRRRIGVVTGIALTAGAVVGVAAAAPTTSTTNVAFVTLTPAHKVLSNTTISANKSTSPVVIGGTTTVPSNATTVQLTVSAKGVAAGTLSFYPAGNASGGSGQSLSWSAGATVSTTIQENVGMSGELTFANASTGSVAVTATLTGYSTQVTAGDIGGTGGSAGQVLTNNGSGGAGWQTPGFARADTSFNSFDVGSTPTVASVSLPAGTYDTVFTAQIFYSAATAYVNCYLLTPTNNTASISFADAGPSSPGISTTTQAMIAVGASGGTISVQCTGPSGATIYYPSLIATQVGNATGAVFASRRVVTNPNHA